MTTWRRCPTRPIRSGVVVDVLAILSGYLIDRICQVLTPIGSGCGDEDIGVHDDPWNHRVTGRDRVVFLRLSSLGAERYAAV